MYQRRCHMLRTVLGFTGVLFSDDLEMKALTMPTGEAAVRAVVAGCDVLLVCSRADLAEEAHEALVREAEKSPAFAARCNEAHARSLAMRLRHRSSRTPSSAGEVDLARVFADSVAVTLELTERLERQTAGGDSRYAGLGETS